MDDYTFAWREMAALPPRRVRTDLAPTDFYDAVLTAIRDDYGLTLNGTQPPHLDGSGG